MHGIFLAIYHAVILLKDIVAKRIYRGYMTEHLTASHTKYLDPVCDMGHIVDSVFIDHLMNLGMNVKEVCKLGIN